MAAWAAGTAIRHATATAFFSAPVSFSASFLLSVFCPNSPISRVPGLSLISAEHRLELVCVTAPYDRAATVAVQGQIFRDIHQTLRPAVPAHIQGSPGLTPLSQARPLSATIPSSGLLRLSRWHQTADGCYLPDEHGKQTITFQDFKLPVTNGPSVRTDSTTERVASISSGSLLGPPMWCCGNSCSRPSPRQFPAVGGHAPTINRHAPDTIGITSNRVPPFIPPACRAAPFAVSLRHRMHSCQTTYILSQRQNIG